MEDSKVFQSLPCLSENSQNIYGKDLIRTWFKGGDKRHLEKLFYDFISLNSDMFKFLGIFPQISDSKSNIRMSFRTTNYIGAIPLRSPIHGLQMGDFIVYPRYIDKGVNKNDYIQVISQLNESIDPDFDYSQNLLSNDQARPPLFFECVKFVNILFDSINAHWQKFSSSTERFNFPKGDIVWKEYIKHEWNPSKRLVYPCKFNELSKDHKDNKNIRYVYEIAKEHIFSKETPILIRNNTRRITAQIDTFFGDLSVLPTKKLSFNNSDPKIIKALKAQGNKILDFNISANKAWRIDFSLVFERYVQQIFQNICDSLGFKYKDNLKIRNNSFGNPLWTLHYLEPDMYIYKNDFSLFLDAKYKSHFYNISSKSDFLVEEHRSDLHQISAYCGFEKSDKKTGILCYPANRFSIKKTEYTNRINSAILNIYLLGIPITSEFRGTIEPLLKQEFTNIYSFSK